MGKGRKPLPDNVHRLNNNPSKKQLGHDTGSDVPVEIPEPPDHLDEGALDEWNRITVELFRLGLIAKIDRASLAVYCMAFSRWAYAEIKISELEDDKGLIQTSPNGYQMTGAWLLISNRATEIMQKAAAEFGMSPSARVRVNPNPQLNLFDDGDQDSNKKETGKGKKATRTPASYFTE